MPKRKPERPLVVSDAERLSPAGRPRLGPRGHAVRELPRAIIRAERVIVRKWLALVQTDTRPGHEVFRAVVEDTISRLPADRRADIERRARAIGRADADDK